MIAMAAPGGTLGIIAGGGELPIAIAQSAQDQGRTIFVVALDGMARPSDVDPFPHGFVSLGELGKAIKLLQHAGCDEVTLAGKVARPEFTKLKLDTRGALALVLVSRVHCSLLLALPTVRSMNRAPHRRTQCGLACA